MRASKSVGMGVLRKDRFLLMLFVLTVLGVVWWGLHVSTCDSLRGGGAQIGKVQHDSLTEISGIALSRQNRDVVWAHNDSGDSARIFAMKTDGTHLGIFTLPGARAIDYEDMAIGPGPLPDVDYLYVADTGNNALDRGAVTVYRAPEPRLAVDGAPVIGALAGVEALPVRFPGRPHECETLLVDPLNGDLYLVSRDRGPGRGGFSAVFRYPAPQEPGVQKTLKLVARFPAPAAIKGGDMSPDGSMILLRAHSMNRRGNALRWNWKRERNLAEIFAAPGLALPTAREEQGEAIAISADGHSYYTIGEGPHAPIFRYPLPRSGQGE